MGLVLVCPRCEARVLLQAQKCPHCEADLRELPQEQRRYLIGRPGPPPAAAVAPTGRDCGDLPAGGRTQLTGRSPRGCGSRRTAKRTWRSSAE